MKPPSVKSVRCAIYTRTADSQITTSSGRWARDNVAFWHETDLARCPT